jgi:hypothetical protein
LQRWLLPIHAPLSFYFRTANARRRVRISLKTGLGADHAVALAQLLPLLGYREEAAAQAFDGFAKREAQPFAYVALRSIAEEESVHEWLVDLTTAYESTSL